MVGLLDAFKQYLNDASPGGLLNPELEQYRQWTDANRARTKQTFQNMMTGKFTPDVLEQTMDLVTPMGLFGTIAGRSAKTANLGLLAKAEEMKKSGKSADDIYKETRWWLDHPDGQPRFEIDDSLSEIRRLDPIEQRYQLSINNPKQAKRINRYEYGLTGQLTPRQEVNYAKALKENGLLDINEMWKYRSHVNHPDLVDAYPQFKDISYQRAESLDGSLGDFSGDFGKNTASIRVSNKSPDYYNSNRPIKDIHSTTLHEGQHAVQSIEKFSRGSSPAEYYYQSQDALDSIREINKNLSRFAKKMDEARKIGDESALKRLKDSYERGLDYRAMLTTRVQIDPMDAYKRTAGESEARLVQDRMNMTMDERLANPFYHAYDVPFEDMILRYK